MRVESYSFPLREKNCRVSCCPPNEWPPRTHTAQPAPHGPALSFSWLPPPLTLTAPQPLFQAPARVFTQARPLPGIVSPLYLRPDVTCQMGLAFQFIYLLFYSYLHSPPICNDLFGEFGITSASSIDPVRPDHAFFFFFWYHCVSVCAWHIPGNRSINSYLINKCPNYKISYLNYKTYTIFESIKIII